MADDAEALVEPSLSDDVDGVADNFGFLGERLLDRSLDHNVFSVSVLVGLFVSLFAARVKLFDVECRRDRGRGVLRELLLLGDDDSARQRHRGRRRLRHDDVAAAALVGVFDGNLALGQVKLLGIAPELSPVVKLQIG